jgi:hypothetical protein
MFTQRSRSGWWRHARARRPVAGQICLLALALGLGILGGCATVSIRDSHGTQHPTSGLVQAQARTHRGRLSPPKSAASNVALSDSMASVSQTSAPHDSAQATVVPTPPTSPTFSPARTPQAAETPQTTTTVEPTATAQPATTATPQPTAAPQPTATAALVPTPQPTPPPAGTSSGGGGNQTLLGLLFLVLFCAVTGIIVWLVATRHRQPPVSDRRPPATD